MTELKRDRIPSLDGLRAIAILLVIAWHASSRSSFPLLTQLWRIDAGNLGVRVFFVLSGFLITTLILAEQDRNGSIALGRFYFRRTLRIMPAFFTFLCAMAVMRLIAPRWSHQLTAPGRALSSSDLLHAATYTANYLPTSWLVGHSWTLAVEEQFYLLWPGLLAFLKRRTAFRVALAMLILSPVCRVLAGSLSHWPDNPRYAFECVADALATGCLLAYLRDSLWRVNWYRRLLSSSAVSLWPLAVAIAAAVIVRFPSFGAVLGYSVLNIIIALGVDWSLRFPDRMFGKILNFRPLVWVGLLSYSLYLWQQPFFSDGVRMNVPLRLVILLVVALVSYFAIEQPFLRLRHDVEASRRKRLVTLSREPAPSSGMVRAE
jgi:peptidoglycan/LPS O-acetylase OafA/YrhL